MDGRTKNGLHSTRWRHYRRAEPIGGKDMQRLIDGVRRFRTEVFPSKKALFADLAKGQSPIAAMISCADSRVDMQLVTQSDPGQLFWFRNAGNIVPPFGAVLGAASATIEYALEALE